MDAGGDLQGRGQGLLLAQTGEQRPGACRATVDRALVRRLPAATRSAFRPLEGGRCSAAMRRRLREPVGADGWRLDAVYMIGEGTGAAAMVAGALAFAVVR